MAKTGSITKYENIIISISANVAGRVDGVASLAGESGGFLRKRRKKNSAIQLFIEDNQVVMDVSIYVFYDHSIPDVAYNIQNGIKNEIESATMFKVKTVNIKVVGVVFPSEV